MGKLWYHDGMLVTQLKFDLYEWVDANELSFLFRFILHGNFRIKIIELAIFLFKC